MSRRLALTALAAGSLLLLTGCGILPFPFVPGGPQSHTPEDVSAELERFYHQDLTWEECGDGVDCTEVTAPLDWADPEGDTITVAVARHRASNGRPMGSLLMNPGGPGGSGYD